MDLHNRIGVVCVFYFLKIICFCPRFHTTAVFTLVFWIFLIVLLLPSQFAPALISLSSHTCFGEEGGVWGSHCLYLNGSVRWAIDDGVQSLLIPRLEETLWCGGTWKQRPAARDPKWSLTIIKYYHPEAGVNRDTGTQAGQQLGRGGRGVCWGPQWVVYSYTPTPPQPLF